MKRSDMIIKMIDFIEQTYPNVTLEAEDTGLFCDNLLSLIENQPMVYIEGTNGIYVPCLWDRE